MINKMKEHSNIPLKTIEELRDNKALFKKVLKIAQFESELDMGVNPKSLEQAHVRYLTEDDFDYIRKVSALVEKRLLDADWLEKTLDRIATKYLVRKPIVGGVKFDDELFKVGRGILESYLKDLEKNTNGITE